MIQSHTTPARIPQSRILKLVLAVSILTLSAKITIPFYPVPMTLQVAAVFLLAGLGGMRFAGASLLSYYALGAAGLPVFAGTPQMGIGLAYMVGPTGGYLVGFLLAALGIGWAVDRFGPRALWLAMPLGLAVIYGAGVIWLSQFVPAGQVLALGVAPFFPGDLLKMAIAGGLSLLAPVRLRAWIRG